MTETVLPPNIGTLRNKSGMSTQRINEFLGMLRRTLKPAPKSIKVIGTRAPRKYKVVRNGIGVLTTRFGKFWQYNFVISDKWRNYSVIVKADVDIRTFTPIFNNKKQLTVRIDSGCESGRVFGDLTCDCAEQMQLSLKAIAHIGEGIIVSVPHQDGRGMGRAFKLATLWSQDILKINTVEAAALVASSPNFDARTYGGVVAILKYFHIPKTCTIRLTTNNSKRAAVFSKNGYAVTEQIPVAVRPNKYTKIHLQAKSNHFSKNDG